jgi:hypothetical protein
MTCLIRQVEFTDEVTRHVTGQAVQSDLGRADWTLILPAVYGIYASHQERKKTDPPEDAGGIRGCGGSGETPLPWRSLEAELCELISPGGNRLNTPGGNM